MKEYLSAAVKTPPGVLFALARKKLYQTGARWTRRTQLRFRQPTLSDESLLRSWGADDAATLIARLRARREPMFFLGADDRASVVDYLSRRYPEYVAAIVDRADLAADHVFDLLGSGPIALGPDIDWCADFKSGYRWESGFHADLVQIDLDNDADVKVPRELSRCHHFVTLAQAYWCTGREKYAREVIAQHRDWVAKNPVRLTINWGCAMDVSIRLANWIWAYFLLLDSPSLEDAWHLEYLKSVKQHADFVVENLEYLGVFSNNHYVADLAGLAMCGVMFPEFKAAPRWRRIGLGGSEAEIFNQVLDDGVHFEGAFGYHRAVTETLATVAILAAGNGSGLSEKALRRLEKMFELIVHYTMPDGRAPQFGDADDGALQFLGATDPADHRFALALGAILFERADFARVAGPQPAAIWLLGRSGAEKLEALAAEPADPPGSRGFPDGGFYFGRSPDAYVAINCSRTGRRGRGSHSHNDTLSFQFHALGRLWLVDPGTYAYTGDWRARNRFRATAAHNTLMVDGEEINRLDPRELFRLSDDARPTVHRWRSTAAFDALDAEHAGYRRLSDPVVHRRQLYFDKARPLLVLRDLVDGDALHDLCWSFHFAPGLEVRGDIAGADPVICALEEEAAAAAAAASAAMESTAADTPAAPAAPAMAAPVGLALAAVTDEHLQREIVEDSFSPSFGVCVDATTVRFRARLRLPAAVTFVAAAYRGNEPPSLADLRRLSIDALQKGFS